MPQDTAAYKPIGHYENFPVATWLCPAHLRAPVAAIYHYARTADDIADEDDVAVAERLRQLREYRLCLWQEMEPPAHWAPLFAALHQQVVAFGLPLPLLDALLSAFEQDVKKTATGQGYSDQTELLDYCDRSANPIGRLLLHLHGVDDAMALQQSDAVCTALQLINFWQDLQHDIPRGRWYVPERDASAFGVSRPMQQQAISQGQQPRALTDMMAHLVGWTRECMHQGMPLVQRLSGRAGWEIRVVIQAGLRVLEKMEQGGYRCYVDRPTIHKADAMTLLWRAWRMPSTRVRPHTTG
ncbi:squalene synthase HpnC [Lampropedia puyangensis]|uniref:Squalene synthase HpnC n=1 Tax=Lampropedia puyangensis TaxID=1330072 RepID=A0A4S8EYK3_9BURK|nr:squalene synthase HpnC [Lampropedia puyangensis]THT99004.1 squalene synthase HpnC [Lampropedia puyangensis]